MMNGPWKSDSPIVPGKSPNKAAQAAAEAMEGRGGAKGNAIQGGTRRTQSRERQSPSRPLRRAPCRREDDRKDDENLAPEDARSGHRRTFRRSRSGDNRKRAVVAVYRAIARKDRAANVPTGRRGHIIVFQVRGVMFQARNVMARENLRRILDLRIARPT